MKNTFLFLTMLFVLSFSIISNHSKGQSTTFSFKYSTSWDEVPTHAIETTDGGFIISAKQGTWNPFSYHTLFIRLNMLGDTVKTTTIYDTAGSCYIHNLVQCSDGNYFAIGTWKQSPQETNIWLIKMSSNLDVLWEKRFATSCSDLDAALGFIDHSGNLIIYSTGNLPPKNTLLIYRCNQNGDSLGGARLTQPSHFAFIFDMAEKTDSTGYYLLIGGRYLVNTYSWGQILRFDTALNITRIDSIPRSLMNYYNLITIRDKILLTGIKLYTGSTPITNKLGLLQLDTAYNVNKERYVGPDDTVSYPGYIHNLDMIDMFNIYYGGTLNQDNSAFFSSKKTWLILGKYDVDLNVKWQKYYGGDLNYGLWSLKATSEGGCLMTGSTFDYLTQNNERDILIIKTDTAGIITGVSPDKTPLIHDVMIYPNPGTEQLFVETLLRGVTLTIVDMTGKSVYRGIVDHSPFLVATGFMNDGQYVYHVKQGKTIIDTGKWIKGHQ